jgi:hypothetical protein
MARVERKTKDDTRLIIELKQKCCIRLDQTGDRGLPAEREKRLFSVREIAILH